MVGLDTAAAILEWAKDNAKRGCITMKYFSLTTANFQRAEKTQGRAWQHERLLPLPADFERGSNRRKEGLTVSDSDLSQESQKETRQQGRVTG